MAVELNACLVLVALHQYTVVSSSIQVVQSRMINLHEFLSLFSGLK